MTRTCDNRSVGVLITDTHDRLLMFRRVKYPVGIAPVAGHVDEHGTYTIAARAEVMEEVGLTVTGLRRVTGGWVPYPCRRQPASATSPQIGHQWAVYQATTHGTDIRLAPDEAAAANWYTHGQVQTLAEQTVMHAAGLISAEEFMVEPGLEPVWVRWLLDVGLVTIEASELDLVDRLARRGPEATR